jgi:hypothetical protein
MKPLTSALLLATAAALSFRATARDPGGSTLGVFVDTSGAQQHLTIAEDGAWTLTGTLPAIPTASMTRSLVGVPWSR